MKKNKRSPPLWREAARIAKDLKSFRSRYCTGIVTAEIVTYSTDIVRAFNTLERLSVELKPKPKGKKK